MEKNKWFKHPTKIKDIHFSNFIVIKNMSIFIDIRHKDEDNRVIF